MPVLWISGRDTNMKSTEDGIEEWLLEQAGKEIKEVIDFSVLLSILPGEINGLKYSIIQEEETFEYVNNHGNETGQFGKRMVAKVICNNKKYTYEEFNTFLKSRGKGA